MATMDYASALTNEPYSPPPNKVGTVKNQLDFVQQNHNYADDLLGNTPNGEQVTPYGISTDKKRAASSVNLMKASFIDTPENKIKFFASKRFPNDPGAVSRYGYDGVNDQVYYKANDGMFYSEDQPTGGVGQFLKRNILGGAGKAIPLTLGTVAGVATAPLNLTGVGSAVNVAATAGASGVGEAIRQGIGKMAFGDDFSGSEIGKEAIFGGVGQGVGLGIAKYGNRGLASDVSRLNQQEVARLVQLAEQQGISLTPAEITNLRSLRNQQRTITRTNEGADIVGDFMKNRNEVQIPNASQRFLSSLSAVDQADVASSNMMQTAGTIQEGLLKARTKAVTPEYRQAVNASRIVPDGIPGTPAIPKKYNSSTMTYDAGTPAVAYVPGPFDIIKKDKEVMSIIRGMKSDPIYQDFHAMPDNSLPVLDQVKKVLDGKISAIKADPALRHQTALLEKSRDRLLMVTDRIFPDYPLARAKFASLSPEVSDVVNGSVGSIAKTKGKVSDLNIIFDYTRSGPVEVAKARAAYEKAGKMDEFNAGLRAFIQNKWAGATKETAQGARVNLAGAMRASIYGDQRARDVMKASMSPDQYEGFERLMYVLEGAARTLPEGSPTVTDALGIKGMKDKAGGLAKAVMNTDLTKPMAGIAQWVEEKSYSRQAETLANIITSPNAMLRLKELKQLSPTSVRARTIVGQILTKTSRIGTSEVVGYGQDLNPGDIRSGGVSTSAQGK